jgi:hypothetical protein
MKEHGEVQYLKKLPRVGQTVKSKKYGTSWRVMEKREVWQNLPDKDPEIAPHLVPAIYIAYWRIKDGVLPGVGKMMGFAYTAYDTTFDTNWEIMG